MAQPVGTYGIAWKEKHLKEHQMRTNGTFTEHDLEKSKKILSALLMKQSLMNRAHDDDGDVCGASIAEDLSILSASNRLISYVNHDATRLEKVYRQLQQSEFDDMKTAELCDEISATAAETRVLLEERSQRREACEDKLRPVLRSTAEGKNKLLVAYCNGISYGRRVETERNAANQVEKRKRDERASFARHRQSVILEHQRRSLPSAVDDCESSSVDKTADSTSKAKRDAEKKKFQELKEAGHLTLPERGATRGSRKRYNTILSILNPIKPN